MTKLRMHREPVVQPQDQSIRHISLTQGQIAIVDAADFEWLIQWNWHAGWNENTKSFYARRNQRIPETGAYRMVRMHHEISNPKPGYIADHRDHDTLNNRRSNLREASYAENSHNRVLRRDSKSGHTGVNWIPSKNRWKAFIYVGGKETCVGTFKSKDEAAAARRDAAAQHYGEFTH